MLRSVVNRNRFSDALSNVVAILDNKGTPITRDLVMITATQLMVLSDYHFDAAEVIDQVMLKYAPPEKPLVLIVEVRYCFPTSPWRRGDLSVAGFFTLVADDQESPYRMGEYCFGLREELSRHYEDCNEKVCELQSMAIDRVNATSHRTINEYGSLAFKTLIHEDDQTDIRFVMGVEPA